MMSSVTIQLPKTLNEESISVIIEKIEDCERDKDCKVIIFVGSDDIFCLGMNFEFIYTEAEKKQYKTIESYINLVNTILSFRKISIAKIEGKAIGGGIGIALMTDFVIANENASFSMPEVLFGMVPGIVLPLYGLRCSPAAAKRIVLSTHSFSAHEAFHLGLVDEVANRDHIENKLKTQLRHFYRCDSDSIKLVKIISNRMHYNKLMNDITFGSKQLIATLKEKAVLQRLRDFYEYGIVYWSD